MEDRSYWAFSKTGNFKVRSCYHHLLEHKGGDADGVPSSTSSPSLLLNWIWDLKVPLKIRMFLWRSCHEIIPTKAALVRRRVGTNPYFEFCSNAIETATHLFSNAQPSRSYGEVNHSTSPRELRCRISCWGFNG